MNRLNRLHAHKHTRLARVPATILGLAMGLAASTQAFAGSEKSTTDAFWIWDPTDIVGEATLVRTQSGISASWNSLGLTPGDAVTMWFVVFNNPAACATTPCNSPDLFNPDVQGDFLVAGGHVIGASGMANFGGHLSVGDAAGSGHIEIGSGLAVGLTNPFGAEVHLLLHSHGPALSGQTLKSQISSYLGGCTGFNGNMFGVALGPGDVPDAVGECSTIQASVHMP